MVFDSKEICNFLIEGLGLPYGKGKCEKVFIPQVFLEDWNLKKSVLRGIMDSDGSIFVSKKPRINKYPSIEITTTSLKLAEQLREILLSRGFRLAKIRKSLSKTSKLPAYRIPLYGKRNVEKWLNEIGFSNKYKEQRALNYIQ